MNNLDNNIKIALNKKTENIKPSKNLLNSIKFELEEKENVIMKKFKFTPKVLIASLVGTVVLASAVIAAGKIASVSSHSSRLNDIKDFPTVEEVQKIVGFSPKYVENLGKYSFDFASPANSTAKDDNGNVIKDFKEINFYYKTEKDGSILSLGADPVIEGLNEENDNAEAIEYKGIVLYYSSSIYKAVPPDYVKTDEDKKLEEKGELSIGFGADEISEQRTQFIYWNEDGISYHVMDMGEEIEKSEFVDMAKQVIDAK